MKKMFVIMMGLVMLTGCGETRDGVPQSKPTTTVPKLGPVNSRGLQMSAWVDGGIICFNIRNVSNRDVAYTEGAGGIGWWEFTHVYVKAPKSGPWQEIGLKGSNNFVHVGNISDDQNRILKPGERAPIVSATRDTATKFTLGGYTPVDHRPNTDVVNLNAYLVPGDLPSRILLKFSTCGIDSPILTIIHK